MWGLASPPHPQGRTESCTLRILRMLLLVLTGAGAQHSPLVGKVRLRASSPLLGATPHLLPFTCFADALAFRGRSPSVTKSSTHLLVFIVLIPLAVFFLWFLKKHIQSCGVAAFLSVLRILWFLPHMQSSTPSPQSTSHSGL